MKRPLVVAVIGYIIGIIIGLYFKFSIVLFYINFIPIGVVIHFINKRKKRKFRLFSIRRYFRYIKIYLNHKINLVIILLSIISNSIVLYKNKKYNFVYKLPEKIEVEATVVSNKQEKEYKNIYKIKIEKINKNKKYENICLYLSANKKIKLMYGDKIKVKRKL